MAHVAAALRRAAPLAGRFGHPRHHLCAAPRAVRCLHRSTAKTARTRPSFGSSASPDGNGGENTAEFRQQLIAMASSRQDAGWIMSQPLSPPLSSARLHAAGTGTWARQVVSHSPLTTPQGTPQAHLRHDVGASCCIQPTLILSGVFPLRARALSWPHGPSRPPRCHVAVLPCCRVAVLPYPVGISNPPSPRPRPRRRAYLCMAQKLRPCCAGMR